MNTRQTIEIDKFLGQQHPLVDQLECADGLSDMHALASELTSCAAATEPMLLQFVRRYRDEILIPVELAAIHRAYEHACRNETRELIAFDQEFESVTSLNSFSSASRRIGRHQLFSLRPLRDQRLVQRYLSAVEAGDAQGWHTLVYGITLAVYSLPVRQGLNAYASKTLAGFLKSNSSPIKQTETVANQWLNDLLEPVPAAIETLVGARAQPTFQG